MERVKADIKSQTFAKLYLLYGDEMFLIDDCAQKIINALTDENTKDMNLMTTSAEIPDIMAVDEFVNSYPFMADKKVLVVRNSYLFTSSGKGRRINDEMKAFWSSTFDDVPDYATIIFVETAVDKRNALYKQIAKQNACHEFKFMQDRELVPWVIKGAKSLGVEISHDDASYLVENSGPSMMNIRTELNKLVNFKGNGGTITQKDIDLVCTKPVEDRVFDMINDLVAGDGNAARKKLNDLMALKEEPIKIISIIFTSFSKYAKYKALQNKPISEISSLMGVHPYHIKNDLQRIKSYPYDKIKAVLQSCMQADFDIKSGKMDGFVAIDLIFAQALAHK